VLEIYKVKAFLRFARSEKLSDAKLIEAVERANAGLIDADLGGGVIKQRVARTGQGKSGGYRTLILFRQGQRAIFAYGFAKNERDNIDRTELTAFRKAAALFLAFDTAAIAKMIEAGVWSPVVNDEDEAT
jgi:hypothetical protein